MRSRVGAVALMAALLLAACGGKGNDALPGEASGPQGTVRLTLNGTTINTQVTFVVRNVFDTQQVYVVNCQQKDHLLDGQPFCDELLVLPPGVYEIIAQSQDPTCHTTVNHYKVIVTAGQTVEIPITMVCESAGGGLDVVVSTEYQPAITGITFTFQDSHLPANKYICQCGEDVRVEIQVTDTDTACNLLVPTWSAVNGAGTNVTGALLSDFQAVPGTPCRFSARIESSMPIDNYQITFSVNDGSTPPTAITFPVHILDCGNLCNAEQHVNTATAAGSYLGVLYTASDPAYFISNGPVASPPLRPEAADVPRVGAPTAPSAATIVDGVNLGELPSYLMYFGDGSVRANWQGATKGFAGNVAVNGIVANETTSGYVPYAGNLYTNDVTFGAWNAILLDNPTQATGFTGEVARLAGLQADLVSAFTQINAMPATPGYTSVSSTSLDGLNTTNGVNETFVINVTSGFGISSQIDITGDPGDVYILRWDSDLTTAGYQGQVKFQSGGAIVPHGGLTPTNFINVAGDIVSSGGGSTPPPPYPQGPRLNGGQGALIDGGADFSGGGFFTGYWLTTGAPTIPGPGGLLIGPTHSLSNGIFVGGWYTFTTEFSMTSGTSGVWVPPNSNTSPTSAIDLIKYVSPDNGVTWFDANAAPGPYVVQGVNPQFKFVVTNTGNSTLTNVSITDDVFGVVSVGGTLIPGQSATFFTTEPWAAGQHTDNATATGVDPSGNTLTDHDPANYFGTQASITVKKYVSGDGVTWDDAQVPTGPILAVGVNPQYKYVVTNNGVVDVNNVTLNDNVLGPVDGVIPVLPVGGSATFYLTGVWAPGLHNNIVTATGTFETQVLTAQDPAYYFGGVNPAIDIQKYVSVDNGLTWFDADTAPGPLLPTGIVPQFKIVVTNPGGAPLSNVTVTDTVFGTIATIPLLNPGDSYEIILVGLP